MAGRRRYNKTDTSEEFVKLIAGLIILLALGGGLKTFFNHVIIILSIVAVAAVGGLCFYIYRNIRKNRAEDIRQLREKDYHEYLNSLPPRKEREIKRTSKPAQDATVTPIPDILPAQQNQEDQPPAEEEPAWTFSAVYDALCKIDWYQFEKFCSALLRSEGYTVERKGGAHPDGGVDLIAAKDNGPTLVQCKHWRTWEIKPKTVREMVGTMKINQADKGAIYTLKGASQAAMELALQQGIRIEEGNGLASRALSQLTKDQLDSILKADVHHCPKCEAEMFWREGNFKPFWGCSRYPRCRGKLEYTGAR